jgi:hypothetical protein
MSLDIEEKDRRYRLARERMLTQGLDALIVVGNAQVAEKGFVKYLTNYKNGLNYVAVVFPYEGLFSSSDRILLNIFPAALLGNSSLNSTARGRL